MPYYSKCLERQIVRTLSSRGSIHTYGKITSYRWLADLTGKLSEFAKLTSGIPQGSNPGPIAFLVLVNSILNYLQHCQNTAMLFGDDFQIYIQCKRSQLPQTIAKLNEEIQNVVNWSINVKLPLNWQCSSEQSKISDMWTFLNFPHFSSTEIPSKLLIQRKIWALQ